jgi:hypothetical protein
VRADEDLARIFTWREWRKVSQSLTLQYDKRLYLLADRPLAESTQLCIRQGLRLLWLLSNARLGINL